MVLDLDMRINSRAEGRARLYSCEEGKRTKNFSQHKCGSGLWEFWECLVLVGVEVYNNKHCAKALQLWLFMMIHIKSSRSLSLKLLMIRTFRFSLCTRDCCPVSSEVVQLHPTYTLVDFWIFAKFCFSKFLKMNYYFLALFCAQMLSKMTARSTSMNGNSTAKSPNGYIRSNSIPGPAEQKQPLKPTRIEMPPMKSDDEEEDEKHEMVKRGRILEF